MALSNARHFQGSRKYFISLVAFFATLIFTFLPSAASAETAWRYWSYWTWESGSWQQAMTGAADVEAIDGSVQGWRYITAGLEVGADLAPRTSATFDDICGDIVPSDARARVAVVVDFGDPSDYSESISIPETITECVVVDAGSPSSLLLPQIAELREDSGLICAINNVPVSGCGEEIEISTEAPVVISEPSDIDESSSFLDNPAVIAGLALALASAAFLVLKNRG